MPTVQELAIAACKRANLDPTHTLRVQTMVPAALSNLAKAVARDPNRRSQLMTDAVSVTLTPGLATSPTVISTTAVADLSSVVANNGVMLDALRYGTIWHQYQITWQSNGVTTGVWSAGSITPDAAPIAMPQGTKVYLQTSGTIPSGLEEDAIYWLITDASAMAFATSAANAETSTSVNIQSQGTGGGTVLSDREIVQWLTSPTQGSLTSCAPFTYLECWLEGYNLHVKGGSFTGTQSKLLLTVPYQPTLADIPDDSELLEDLIDTLVAIALTAGVEDQPPNDRRD